MSYVEKFIVANEEQAETLFNGGTVVSPSGEQIKFEEGDVTLVPVSDEEGSGGSKLYEHYLIISTNKYAYDIFIVCHKATKFEDFDDFKEYFNEDESRIVHGYLVDLNTNAFFTAQCIWKSGNDGSLYIAAYNANGLINEIITDVIMFNPSVAELQ